MNFFRHLFLLGLCLVLVAGCSSERSAQRIDYKKAVTLPPLEVPPELDTPVNQGDLALPEASEATLSGQQGGQPVVGNGGVLPTLSQVSLGRDGALRWLVIEAEPEAVWPRVKQFWLQLGLELKLEEPALGIMETQWAENRADVPESFLRGLISRAFKGAYSADTRDKFRVRLERGERPGSSELFLTHYGIQEVVKGESQTVWQPRPSDPELANLLLMRLMQHLGVKPERAEELLAEAQPAERARLQDDGEGRPVLWLADGFDRSWRRVGIGLDRIGLVVEDRDRSKGLYFIRAVDLLKDADKKGEGWFSRLFSGKKEPLEGEGKYRIALSRDGDSATRVLVQNAQGEGEGSEAAREILQRLQQQLR